MKKLMIAVQALIMYSSLIILGGYMLEVLRDCDSDLEFFVSTCFFFVWIVCVIGITLFIKEIKKKL